MTTGLRTTMVSEFVCLADKCEDTCCRHWSMQVDNGTYALYKDLAPELLDSVERDVDDSFIMRKDKTTGECVRLEGGKCGIQMTFGNGYLGDACHFYPRVTRAVGEVPVMTATISCPEVARLALYSEQPFHYNEVQFDRLPIDVNDVAVPELSMPEMLAVHNAFMDAAQGEGGAEMNFARIASVARSLDRVEKKDWAGAAPLYFKMTDNGLPKPERDINDPFNLLHALCGLVVASRKPVSPRLQETISEIEAALQVEMDWNNVRIITGDESAKAYDVILRAWQIIHAKNYELLLKRWLAAQISTAFFPYAGLGNKLSERITIIGVRFATLKLALMCACGINEGMLPQEVVVRMVQGLSRFLDHLGNPEFSLSVYAEAGWDRESRMLGLLEVSTS